LPVSVKPLHPNRQIWGTFFPETQMGATIANAPPAGLFFASTAFYIPMAAGNGNADCGPGCKERYNAVGASVNLTWGSGWKFLGADYYPTIQTGGYQATATVTPYPPGGERVTREKDIATRSAREGHERAAKCAEAKRVYVRRCIAEKADDAGRLLRVGGQPPCSHDPDACDELPRRMCPPQGRRHEMAA
jgi:hypothetical protein